MARKRLIAEQMATKLRHIEVLQTQGKTILLERERIKHNTIKTRRLHHRGIAA